MYQIITKRDDKFGYKVIESNLPKIDDETIIYLPEVSTTKTTHMKYVSKYTQENGTIIVKLVRSDGLDPFGRPKALAHNLLLSPEEYNNRSLSYFASPLLKSMFDDIMRTPNLLSVDMFEKKNNLILEVLDLKILREIIVAAMIQEQVVLIPNLDQESLLDLASLIDKAIPYEASYDFSLISYADNTCSDKLIHNILYLFADKYKGKKEIKIKNIQSKSRKIAKQEKEYLNQYIDMIINEDFTNLIREHARWVIGMYHEEHKELQKYFTSRYQLNIPFGRRNKFHQRYVKFMSKFS